MSRIKVYRFYPVKPLDEPLEHGERYLWSLAFMNAMFMGADVDRAMDIAWQAVRISLSTIQ